MVAAETERHRYTETGIRVDSTGQLLGNVDRQDRRVIPICGLKQEAVEERAGSRGNTESGTGVDEGRCVCPGLCSMCIHLPSP